MIDAHDTPLAFADIRCRRCDYALAGLDEARCPECGAAFDPADPRTFRRGDSFARTAFARATSVARGAWRWVRPRVPFAAGLGASWLLYGCGLSLLFWMPTVALAVQRRVVAAASCVVLGPLGILFVENATSYARGGSQFVRPPGNTVWTEQGNLDRATRLRGFDPGCGTHDENYWLRRLAENAARVAMHAFIGPPPGAYTGAYPTLPEARTTLAMDGVRQPAGAIEDGRLALPGRTVRLRDDLSYYGFVVASPDASPATAAIDRQGCVIVRVPRDVTPPTASIYLIDAATGQAFAVYRDVSPTPP